MDIGLVIDHNAHLLFWLAAFTIYRFTRRPAVVSCDCVPGDCPEECHDEN